MWDAVGRSGKRVAFYSAFQHTIDDKGRVSLPAKYRSELGDRVAVSISIRKDHCLALYSSAMWASVVARLAQLPAADEKARRFRRHLLSSATDLDVDSHGRILLPAELREYAGLDRDVTFVGMGLYVEIWDRACFSEDKRKAEADPTDNVEPLADLGL